MNGTTSVPEGAEYDINVTSLVRRAREEGRAEVRAKVLELHLVNRCSNNPPNDPGRPCDGFNGSFCEATCNHCFYEWPCPTVRAVGVEA